MVVVQAIQKHWQSSLLAVRCNSNHSITNNVMQQMKSFSMSGKCK